MKSTKKGFTLIELLVVVAIIGILAAIAIPSFVTFLAKSRRTELYLGLGGIYTVELAYFAAHDKFKVGSINCTDGFDPNFTVGGLFNLDHTASFYIGFCIDVLPPIIQNTFTACGEGNIDTDPTNDLACVDEANRVPTLITDDIVS